MSFLVKVVIPVVYYNKGSSAQAEANKPNLCISKTLNLTSFNVPNELELALCAPAPEFEMRYISVSIVHTAYSEKTWQYTWCATKLVWRTDEYKHMFAKMKKCGWSIQSIEH